MDYASFIRKLFEARQVVHNEHLAATRYGAHKALGDLYDEILDVADELAEVYQGEFGLLDLSGSINVGRVDPEVYIRELASLLKGMGSIVGNTFQSYHQNIVDGLIAKCYRTLYMLTLK